MKKTIFYCAVIITALALLSYIPAFAEETAAAEYGSIQGNVKFDIAEDAGINFENKEAVITACADKPFTAKELKNHFYGEQSSYFFHHIPLYKANIDKDGNFVLSNIKPGEYDLVIFNKRETPWGYQRVAWKTYVNIEKDRVTKVRLDNYNTALDDFVYLQQFQ